MFIINLMTFLQLFFFYKLSIISSVAVRVSLLQPYLQVLWVQHQYLHLVRDVHVRDSLMIVIMIMMMKMTLMMMMMVFMLRHLSHSVHLSI